MQSNPEYVAGLFVYLFHGKDLSVEYPIVPTDAIIHSKSGGETCQPQGYETFSFQGSGGDKEKQSNDIISEFRGYDVIDEKQPPYIVNAYQGQDLSSNEIGDNALDSAWVYIFQQTIVKYAQRDAKLGTSMGRLWPNMEVGNLPGKTENSQTFRKSPLKPQKYKNLGRMLQLVTGEDAAQKLVKGITDKDLRAVLDAAPKSPVLVIPKESNEAKKLNKNYIWIAKKESSGHWSFVNPLEKDKSKITLSLAEFKALAEEIAYLKDHQELKL